MSDLRDQAHRALTRGHHRRTSRPTAPADTAALFDTEQICPTVDDTVDDGAGHPITLPAEPAMGGGSREDNQP